MKFTGGKFIVEWSDGRRREVGSVDFDMGVVETRCKMRMRRWVLGWEFVRIGLRIWRRGIGHESMIVEDNHDKQGV